MSKITISEFAQDLYNDITIFKIMIVKNNEYDANVKKARHHWMDEFLSSIEWLDIDEDENG